MAKIETFQDLALEPARESREGRELWRWLHAEIRRAILEGRLKRGSRIPSTRALASQYSLSRGTVTTAFDQLHAEGYIASGTGSGTFVVPTLPEDSLVARRCGAIALPESRASLSKRGRMMTEAVALTPASRSVGKAFRNYEPAIDLFPRDLWARIAGRVMRRAPRTLYGQGDAAGYLPLRRAIAEYLGAARGVSCDAAQIIVTSGAQQALDLTARLLLDPGDTVWMEDPGYPGARLAFRGAGADIVPMPVDQDGLRLPAEAQPARVPKLIYATPANQFPLGYTMSVERRLGLLERANAAGAWIVEDEYDAEYRYSGHPEAALHGLDASGSVIYIGSFTKMLFNALRLGFLVVPLRMATAFQAARSFTDRHPPTLDQAILAEFILEGHFGHHVRRMRQIYAERMAVLNEAAGRYLAGALEVVQATAGMRTLAWVKTGSDSAIARRARAFGLELGVLSQLTIRYPQPPALILGFAGSAAGELRRGVRVLAAALPEAGRLAAV